MKYQTTIPRRYELGERLIYAVLLMLTIIGIAASFACGDAQELDDEPELGTAQEGITANFSTTYTYGYGQGDLRLNTASPGSNPAIIPGRVTIRYKFVGTDVCEGSPKGRVSWKEETLRGLEDMNNAINAWGGNPFTLVEDNANPSVTIQKGTCPGLQESNSISSFFCASWQGALVAVSNPSGAFGSYKRHDGVLAITIDWAKAWRRAKNLGVDLPDVNDCNGGKGDFHALLEHIGHAAAMLPYGQAPYPTTKRAGPGFPALEFPDPNYPSWATPEVLINYRDAYDTAGYPAGVICRAASYRVSMPTSQFIRGTGTCVD
jgi:hypothetical protein